MPVPVSSVLPRAQRVWRERARTANNHEDARTPLRSNSAGNPDTPRSALRKDVGLLDFHRPASLLRPSFRRHRPAAERLSPDPRPAQAATRRRSRPDKVERFLRRADGTDGPEQVQQPLDGEVGAGLRGMRFDPAVFRALRASDQYTPDLQAAPAAEQLCCFTIQVLQPQRKARSSALCEYGRHVWGDHGMGGRGWANTEARRSLPATHRR